MPKNGKNGKHELAKFSEYKIAQVDTEALVEVIRQNVGSGGLAVGDMDTIKVPGAGGTQWTVKTLEEGEKDVPEFTGVIIAFTEGRRHWESEYDGSKTPPSCMSDDCVHGVGTPGGDCTKCPLSKFGSDPKGGRGQACAMRRVLLVMLKDSVMPTIVSLPPTSLKAARNFFYMLTADMLPYFGALVRFGLAKEKNKGGITYARVDMRLAARLTKDEVARIAAIREAITPEIKKAILRSQEDSFQDGNGKEEG